MTEKQVEPHMFVILGATGNLTSQKLFPAIYRLSTKGKLKEKSKILGVARKKLSDRDFRVLGREMLESGGLSVNDSVYSPWCDSCLFYQSIGEAG